MATLLNADTNYLSLDHLRGFKKYKYNSIDTNPIGVYIMHPFWNWLIQYFPKWIAPNVLTLAGFLFIVKSFLLLSYYDYYFYGPIPRWVYAAVSINVFISYTLDGIDGKQARRTNTSGPLGELFDHGLDSWTTVFIPIFIYSLFGRTEYSLPPFRLYWVCWTVFVNFYMTHVEKYNTGVMYLPWSYDLSMLGVVVMFAFPAIFGPDVWKGELFSGFTYLRALEATFYALTIFFNMPVVARNLYTARMKKTDKNLSFAEGVKPLISLMIFFFLSAAWVFYSPTDIVSRDPRIFCLLSGNIFSNICVRLIVAQMSDTRCDAFNILFLPYGVGILVSLWASSLELATLYILFVATTFYHIRYGSCIVRQLCDSFNIHCFCICKLH